MRKNILSYLVAALLTAFALITLFLSSSVIFDLFGIRAREGHYVPFVVWSNFIGSLLYLAAAVGITTLKPWAAKPLWLAVALLIVAFIGLLVHVGNGGAYETKTIAAMGIRIALTLAFGLVVHFKIVNSKV